MESWCGSRGRSAPRLLFFEPALANAKPMDDRYYRHLLFGENGQYIPELDGLR
jgi:hypothetical protein